MRSLIRKKPITASYCDDCPDRFLCTDLCKEAERYVNQDHVKLKEVTVSNLLYATSKWPYPETGKEKLSPREKAVLIMVSHGVPKPEIMKVLHISPKLLTDYLHRARRKLR